MLQLQARFNRVWKGGGAPDSSLKPSIVDIVALMVNVAGSLFLLCNSLVPNMGSINSNLVSDPFKLSVRTSLFS